MAWGDRSRKGKPNKCKADYTLKDAWKWYKKQDDGKDRLCNDEKTFRKIALTANKKFIEKILEGETFKMPLRLGEIRIRKSKLGFDNELRRLPIDWETSMKLKKKIYHLNDHTNNHIYRWYWRRLYGNMKMSRVYFFRAGRLNERKLKDVIKDENSEIDYFM